MSQPLSYPPLTPPLSPFERWWFSRVDRIHAWAIGQPTPFSPKGLTVRWLSWGVFYAATLALMTAIFIGEGRLLQWVFPNLDIGWKSWAMWLLLSPGYFVVAAMLLGVIHRESPVAVAQVRASFSIWYNSQRGRRAAVARLIATNPQMALDILEQAPARVRETVSADPAVLAPLFLHIDRDIRVRAVQMVGGTRRAKPESEYPKSGR